MSAKQQLAGQRFTRLTVVCRTTSRERRYAWECRCDCGTQHFALTSDLMRGRVKSCGCLNREPRGGLASQPEYQALRAARLRCSSSNHPQYARYGGRGIEFRLGDDLTGARRELIAAIGVRPTADHSLDRIDNDGHYEIGNLRWATRSEQRRNQGPRARKNRCANGHEFDSGNTRTSMRNGRVRRVCRACSVAASLRYQARKKEATA